ncbi:MAG: hypothetical protein ACKVY0_02715 [Prosthecobacter sp.]|uniref:hypothetical protein n=1 Tax=Prosthecobacter sp. TaxID=1965333 RepID=UPI003903DE6C
MKFLAWLVFSLAALCSCTTQHSYPKAVYGDPVPSSIAVTVGGGFLFRGTYHLPKGTRLGLLLDVAKVLPSAKDLRSDGAVMQMVPCSVRSASGKYKANADFDKITKPEFRDFVLRDGDEVAFFAWNF